MKKLMCGMFWNNFTKEEADEYYLLLKKMSEWTSYCETTRKNKSIINYSLDLSNQEYYTWDRLSKYFWSSTEELCSRFLQEEINKEVIKKIYG